MTGVQTCALPIYQGRNIHIVGLSLNYMKIRMKSGLEGFVPITALE